MGITADRAAVIAQIFATLFVALVFSSRTRHRSYLLQELIGITFTISSIATLFITVACVYLYVVGTTVVQGSFAFDVLRFLVLLSMPALIIAVLERSASEPPGTSSS
jgi:hypothetical protein